jgi:hypothetical protein
VHDRGGATPAAEPRGRHPLQRARRRMARVQHDAPCALQRLDGGKLRGAHNGAPAVEPGGAARAVAALDQREERRALLGAPADRENARAA